MFLLLLTTPPLPAEPSSLWQIAAQYGFNALLVILLLLWMREERKEAQKTRDAEMAESRKERDRWRGTIDRQAKLVTLALIHVGSAIPGVKEQLESLNQDLSKALDHEKEE